MFTGLVKCLGTIVESAALGKGRRFRIELAGLDGLEVGQSVAVNGTCLTATRVSGTMAVFEVVAETVSRTNLGGLRAGDRVNLEPALKVGDALDGHMVLGHVDALAPVLRVESAHADQRVITIGLPEPIRHLVAEKGSVAVDGISLTVARAGDDWFTVSVIPHSWDQTTLSLRNAGDGVNIEVDVLARYTARILQYDPGAKGGLSENFLRENGFA